MLMSLKGIYRNGQVELAGKVQKWIYTIIMKPKKISYKRGDVVLALFPNSSLRTAKRRPVLIVQANHLGTGLSQVIVAMISSNMSRAGHASRFTVRRSSPLFHASGLLSDSVVMTDNLATITTKALERVIGQ